MNVKYENLAGYESNKKSGLGYENIGYIYFWGKEEILEEIKKYIVNNFITYTHDGKVKFGEQELFFHGGGNHFNLKFNSNKNGEIRDKEIYEQIKNKLEADFNKFDFTVKFGIGYALSKIIIEDFIDNYVVDLDNLELNKFNHIRPCVVGFPKLKEESYVKLNEIHKQVMNLLEGKKVEVNGMKGQFRKVRNTVGFFKQRARVNYYNLNIENMRELKII